MPRFVSDEAVVVNVWCRAPKCPWRKDRLPKDTAWGEAQIHEFATGNEGVAHSQFAAIEVELEAGVIVSGRDYQWDPHDPDPSPGH
jgi:hypothetical protein